MKKKVLSILLALAMVLPLCPAFELSLLSTPVFAAETISVTTKSERGKVKCGETFTVTVSLDQTVNSRGINLLFKEACDWNVFELVSAEYNAGYAAKCLMALPNLTNKTATSSAMAAFDWTGDFFTLTLKVKDDEAFGSYDVSMDSVFIYDANKQKSEAVVIGTSVEVCQSCAPSDHVYDNPCVDTDCNICGEDRTPPHDYTVRDKDETNHWLKCSLCGTVDESSRASHVYDDFCFDTDCNECGATRIPPHVFDSATDSECNLCQIYRPVPPVAEAVVGTTVTIQATDGFEYSLDGNNWQASPVFENLDPMTTYTFYQRQAEKEDYYASPASAPLVVKTLPVIPGDTDGDDVITMDDAIYVLFHTSFPTEYPANQDLDFNGDGKVDMDDAIALLFYVFFPERFPLN